MNLQIKFLSISDSSSSSSSRVKPKSTNINQPASDEEKQPLQKSCRILQNEDYELWQDKNELNYVKLTALGLEKIAQNYKKKYNVDIDVVELKDEDLKEYICEHSEENKEKIKNTIKNKFAELGDPSKKGLIFLVINQIGFIKHAMPFLIQKNFW